MASLHIRQLIKMKVMGIVLTYQKAHRFV